MDTKTILIIAGAFGALLLLLMLFRRPKYKEKSNLWANIALIAGLIFTAFQLFKKKKDPLEKEAEQIIKKEIKDREEKIEELEEKKEHIKGDRQEIKHSIDDLNKEIEELEEKKEHIKEESTNKKSVSDAANKLKNL